MEEVEIKIPAFRVVTVFDYSQTDGKELPGLGVSELHGNVEDLTGILWKHLARVSPVPIRYEGMEGDRKGYFIDLNHPIAIKEGMGEAQTAKTGVHEVGARKTPWKRLNRKQGLPKTGKQRKWKRRALPTLSASISGLIRPTILLGISPGGAVEKKCRS